MENKIIAANLKMNFTKEEVEAYLNQIEGKIPKKQVIFFPTSIYASLFLEEKYKVGLQNIYQKEKGSFTGEISPVQAESLGITYVLLGHSERRYFFHETEEEIGEKVKLALESHLHVILCIGETEKEKMENRIEEAIERQLRVSLKDISSLQNLMIAYEPVWSIGTGKIPNKEEIEKVWCIIKEGLQKLRYEDSVPLLYGGSVDAHNIAYLKEMKEVDGYLLGGSSLDTDSLLKIIEVAVTM